jgi:DNA-directed RNA polymerase subunit H (RpoH/RPB5)
VGEGDAYVSPRAPAPFKARHARPALKGARHTFAAHSVPTTMSKHSVMAAVATVKEMLTDRGLELGALRGVGEDEVQALISSLDIFSLEAGDRDVLFILKKLKNNELVKAAELIEVDRRATVIIVSKDKMSTVNLKCVAENFNAEVECFTLDELMVNISKHTLVPQHTILSPADAAALVIGYKLKSPTQLPIIYRSDPMARYIGAKAGDVVKIVRKSATAGETLFYRYCV